MQAKIVVYLSFLWHSKSHVLVIAFFCLRVQPGHCYHLYNGLRASLLDDYQLPEILRTPLEELCLQIKVYLLGEKQTKCRVMLLFSTFLVEESVV